MATIFRKQRVLNFTEKDGFHFVDRKIKPDNGRVWIHGDVEVGYREDNGKTIRRVIGHTFGMDLNQYKEFCANPPVWFRSE